MRKSILKLLALAILPLFAVQASAQTDILFERNDGAAAVWFMNASNQVSGTLLNPGSVGDAGWQIVATGKVNTDTKQDILFQHTNGDLSVWYMDGINLVSSAYLNPSGPGDPAWRVKGAGDFNGDGKTDLVFQYSNGDMSVWYMDGPNLLSPVLVNPSHPGSGWWIKGTGDFNRDGKTDLVFQHDNGSLAAWHMDGITMTAGYMISPSNPGIGWTLRTTGDLNKDGNTDLIFQHSSGVLASWFLNGVTATNQNSLKPENPGTGWQVMAAGFFDTADTDGDGLTFCQELRCGTSPILADSNGNGKMDNDEDPDNDYVANSVELQQNLTDPLITRSSPSTNVTDGEFLFGAKAADTGLRLVVTLSGNNYTVKIDNAEAGKDYMFFSSQPATPWKLEKIVHGQVGATSIVVPNPGGNLSFAGGTAEDVDADGLPDAYELFVTKTVTTDGRTTSDTDSDGVGDDGEDFDGDKLSNIAEMKFGKNPFLSDNGIVPKKLLVYYGWPSSIETAKNFAETDPQRLTVALSYFKEYDYVILGWNLEEPGAEHERTKEMLRLALVDAPGTMFFGYIPLNTTLNYTRTEIEVRLGRWKEMKVHGIFFDEFGFDYLKNPNSTPPFQYDPAYARNRQNYSVQSAHEIGFAVIANAFHPEDALGQGWLGDDPQGNPLPTTSILPELATVGKYVDTYFYEEHQFRVRESDPNDLGHYVGVLQEGDSPSIGWKNKAATIRDYELGEENGGKGNNRSFRIMSVTTTRQAYDQAAFYYSWYSAFLFGHEATGWGEPEFSASGTFNAVAPFHTRPPISAPPGVPTTFTGVPTWTGSTGVTRLTNTGSSVRVDTIDHEGFYP